MIELDPEVENTLPGLVRNVRSFMKTQDGASALGGLNYGTKQNSNTT